MLVRGVELMGDLSTLEKYLRKHDIFLETNAHGQGSDQDQGSYFAQRGQLQQWLEMTQHGLGRHDGDSSVSPHAPLLRLTDALMSLNYLIATGT